MSVCVRYAPRFLRDLCLRRLWLATSLLLCVALPANAQQSRFDIPAGPLASALNRLADRGDLQIAYDASLTDGLETEGVAGVYSPEQALEVLLAGTGLDYRFTGAETVTLEQTVAANDGVIELSPISVVGQRDTGYAAETAISATRTGADIQDLPVTVEVLNQRVIEDTAAVRVGEALSYVAGANRLDADGGRFTDIVNIRGFRENFVLNGLRRSNAILVPQDIANIERIEVLKGPASVLYGQLEPGGVINLVTKQPLDEPFTEFNARIGEFDFYRAAGDVSRPLNEEGTVRFRLNAAYEDTESFRDFFEREHFFIAPVLAIDLGPDTLLTLEGDFTRDDFLFDNGIPARGQFLPNINGNFPDSRWIGEPDLEGDIIEASTIGYRLEHRFSDRTVLRNAFRFERVDREEANIFGLGFEPDQRTLNRGLFIIDDTTDDYLVQTDLVTEFATGSIEHELLVGFDYRKNEQDGGSLFEVIAPLDIFNPVYGNAAPPTTALTPFSGELEIFGLYLQDRIALSDKFKLLAGVRYDDPSQEEDSEDIKLDEEFTTQFGIVYQPVETVSLYANRTEAFIPQGSMGEAFDPLLAEQYEVGVKADLLDGALSTNLAVYEITQENIFTTNPDDLGGPEIQIGEIESRGVEFSIGGQPMLGWNIIASYAYTDTEFIDFLGVDGNENINVPDHTVSLFTRYDILTGPLVGLGFSAGINYVGERQLAFDNTFQLPDYTLVDLGLRYVPRDNVELGLFVENTFDEEYFYGGFGEDQVFPGAPRTVFGTVRIAFD